MVLVSYITNLNHRKQWLLAETIINGIEWAVENSAIMSPTNPRYGIGLLKKSTKFW